VSATGNVRLGEKNSGTVLDVRNSANASRKVTGVADATLSTSSTEAVTGKQLNTTNENVAKAQTAADTAKMDAGNALAQAVTLGGLVGQVSATGNVRLGEENSGTLLDVRNNKNENRRINGVSDGDLSAGSSDGVSGRQLFATNVRLAAVESAGKYISVGVDAFSRDAVAGQAGVAIGDSAKAGAEGATAVGAFSTSLGRNGVAIGRA
ncbi:hypothetical protein J6396_34985, partial [Pseudomonas aeruginosa]|nr:hypothetical protein [Pseudomonas aeruginosa]